MKSVTDLLQRTPWWALLFTGLATFVALAVFVTPYHILQYREGEGKSLEESRAIKREIDNAFAENAINVGRSVIRGMLARTTDPERRTELEEALAGLEEARVELRQAGTEALRTKREAILSARQAARTSLEAIRRARIETEEALRTADPADKAGRAQIEETLKQARAAEREAQRAIDEGKAARIVIGPKAGEKPMIDIEVDPNAVPAPPAPPAEPAPPPLAPEVATKIRRDVTGDMYRIGIGAALVLVLVPLFVLAVVTKFFADRSRASQKVAEVKRREAEYHRMGQQVTEAKLAALQAQVEPHFLYNTLASVQALTEVDPAKANEMTGHLIQYLRNALPKMRESVSTVGQEVELVRAYLSILQMRMGERLAFEIVVPEALMALPFPPLMLPSLVENSIKHGLEPQREGGTVRIGASVEDGRLRLVVADTGRGFGETVGAGVGLANIRERLAALYGERAHLTLEENPPHGVVATIEVPAQGTGANANAAAAAAVPPPIPPSMAAGPVPAMLAAGGASAKTGFWARTFDMIVVFERGWRKALYWLYLALLVVAALVAVAAVVGIAVGAFPVVMDDDVLTGPAGALIGLAAAIVGFVAVAAALALVMIVLYGLGFFMVALAIFVGLVAIIAISPLVAPFALFGLFVWWMARRSKRRAEAAAAAAPAR
ncbi:MAG TPA: histidine kinase [Usitatibacter sp.]|nr:histidine kinase [Usitatibacter sp.]